MVIIANRLKDGEQPGSLRYAVYLWQYDRETALVMYGPIENWKTCVNMVYKYTLRQCLQLKTLNKDAN